MFWARTLTNLLWIGSISCSFVEIDWCSCVQRHFCVCSPVSLPFIWSFGSSRCTKMLDIVLRFFWIAVFWICAPLPRHWYDVRMFHVWWSACLQQFILVSQEFKIPPLLHLVTWFSETYYSSVQFFSYVKIITAENPWWPECYHEKHIVDSSGCFCLNTLIHYMVKFLDKIVAHHDKSQAMIPWQTGNKDD